MNNKEYDKLWGRHSLHCQEIHDLFKTHEKLRKDHEDALARIALLEAKLEAKVLTSKKFKALAKIARSARSLRGKPLSPGYCMYDLGINRVALAGKIRINSCHLDDYMRFYISSKSKALAGPRGKLP